MNVRFVLVAAQLAACGTTKTGPCQDSVLLVGSVDVDGDGFGALQAWSACDDPPGPLTDDTDDCFDGDPHISPLGEDFCDGENWVDADCDGTFLGTDEFFVVGGMVDSDGDGFGRYASWGVCQTPPGPLVDIDAEADCNDYDAAVHPGAVDVPGDGIDSDCDGAD